MFGNEKCVNELFVGVKKSFKFNNVMTELKREWLNETIWENFSVPESVSVANVTLVSDQGGGPSIVIISLYVIIFVLAVSGNTLVLVTLAQNKRMRTVTNVYLLNLVSTHISFDLIFLFKLHSNIPFSQIFLSSI